MTSQPLTDEKPFPNSYWVRPGRLLAGEYPGSEFPDVARERVDALLGSGVTYCLDLTAPDDPLEPYDDLLSSNGHAGKGIIYARRAIPDMRVPPVDDMRAILDEIDAAIDQGHVVYVHCWGGIGRTGTVVGCHFVRHGMDGEDALEEVQRLYDTMSEEKRRHFPWSPQTTAQCDFVRRWPEGGGSAAT